MQNPRDPPQNPKKYIDQYSSTGATYTTQIPQKGSARVAYPSEGSSGKAGICTSFDEAARRQFALPGGGERGTYTAAGGMKMARK